MWLLLVRRRVSLCHRGSPRAPASGGATAAVCMQVRETEQARGGRHARVGPRGLGSGMGAGRGRRVRLVRTLVHCPTSSPNRTPGASKSVLNVRIKCKCILGFFYNDTFMYLFRCRLRCKFVEFLCTMLF
jgi:hypothetical protein